MNNLLFDDLPEAISKIWFKLNAIETILNERQNEDGSERTDRWFSLEELQDYVPGNPAKATIYGWVHDREIPHKKFGKRLAFLKSEIDEWLKSKRRRTVSEIREEADSYVPDDRRNRSGI